MAQQSIVSVVLILALAAGCEHLDAADDKAGGGSGDPDLAALADAIASVECARRQRCELPDERFVDDEACAGEVSASLTRELGPLVARGTLSVVPEAVEACRAALVAAECEMDLERLNALCPGAIRGHASAGGWCEHSVECAGDSVCAEDLDDLCNTECRPRSDTTECLYDHECPSGYGCLGDPGACVRLASEGDDCGDGELPECGPGLYCAGGDLVEGTVGVCQPVGAILTEALGERCDPEVLVLCAPGLVCAIDACDGLGCTHRCQAAPAPGESCTLGFLPADPCPAGHYCHTDPIDDDDETAEVGERDGMRGVCTPLPGLGEDCAASECGSGLRCVLEDDGLDERCRAPLPLGASCEDDDACESWVCADGVCAEPSCEEEVAL